MKILALTFILATLGLFVGHAHAAVIYYESFSVATNANNVFPINGWNLHAGSGAGTLGSMEGANNQAVGINDNRTTNFSNVNAGTSNATTDTQTGRTFYSSGIVRTGLLWTSEYVVDTSSLTVENMRWWNRSDTAYTNRAAVQVGGSWFVSSTAAASTGATVNSPTDGGTWTQIGVNFTTAQWVPITFTAGSALTQTPSGTPQSLPAGNITAFGVYHQGTNTGTARVDGFEINAVPEPASLTLLSMAGLGLLAFRRARK